MNIEKKSEVKKNKQDIDLRPAIKSFEVSAFLTVFFNAVGPSMPYPQRIPLVIGGMVLTSAGVCLAVKTVTKIKRDFSGYSRAQSNNSYAIKQLKEKSKTRTCLKQFTGSPFDIK
jgi:hypothetical protein